MQHYFFSNHISTRSSSLSFISSAAIFDAALVQAELAAEYRREISRLDDLAYAFLTVSSGDSFAAERQLDDFVDLLLNGGALSLWRYRVVLRKIREGF